MKVNRVLVVSEFVLSDDNGYKVRIKHMDGSWHFVVDGNIVFSFSEKDAEDLVNLFKDICNNSDKDTEYLGANIR